jgi:hypothetical protein
MNAAYEAHRLYSPDGLSIRLVEGKADPHPGRIATMLDLAFIATGAAFLIACVLYAYACEQL